MPVISIDKDLLFKLLGRKYGIYLAESIQLNFSL
jgi:hypothetical protein